MSEESFVNACTQHVIPSVEKVISDFSNPIVNFTPILIELLYAKYVAMTHAEAISNDAVSNNILGKIQKFIQKYEQPYNKQPLSNNLNDKTNRIQQSISNGHSQLFFPICGKLKLLKESLEDMEYDVDTLEGFITTLRMYDSSNIKNINGNVLNPFMQDGNLQKLYSWYELYRTICSSTQSGAEVTVEQLTDELAVLEELQEYLEPFVLDEDENEDQNAMIDVEILYLVISEFVSLFEDKKNLLEDGSEDEMEDEETMSDDESFSP